MEVPKNIYLSVIPITSMNNFAIIFDIPKEMESFRVRIHRDLLSIRAQKIQQSYWKAENLKELIGIASLIKSCGGSARILEEKLIF
jgi:hypothetical protein